MKINTSEASLLITEPYFNLPNIQDVYDQFIFEEYEFKAYHRCTRELHLFRWGSAIVVISSGFSIFSSVTRSARSPTGPARSTIPGVFTRDRLGIQFYPCYTGTQWCRGMGRGEKVSLCLRVVTVCADPNGAQNRRRWEATNQSPQRDRVLPPVEHDGRDSHNKRGQRGVLLRLRGL